MATKKLTRFQQLVKMEQMLVSGIIPALTNWMCIMKKAIHCWTPLYGAVIGDICGSIYEFSNRKTDRPEEIALTNDKCYFTDDTVLTAAVADAVTNGLDYGETLWKWGRRYSNVGYGPMFSAWLQDRKRPEYGSYGNGAAMRISPVIWRHLGKYWPNITHQHGDQMMIGLMRQDVIKATTPTHGHAEGIRGAAAIGEALFLAWCGFSKEAIKDRIQAEHGYALDRPLKYIRPAYEFDVSCQGTVPVAITAFMESHDFVSAIQNAISVGGDSDTIAAITGSLAEAYYKDIPSDLKKFARSKVPMDIQVALGMRKSAWWHLW